MQPIQGKFFLKFAGSSGIFYKKVNLDIKI